MSDDSLAYAIQSSFRDIHTCLFRTTALHDFRPAQPDELPLNKGDTVEVSKDKGEWWTGKCRGLYGVFPANHVV